MPLGDSTHQEQRRLAIAAFIATLETKPEFNITSSIFSTSTPTEAVRALITHTTPLLTSPSSLETSLYDTACSILELAKRTPAEHQQPLLTFLRELQAQTAVDPETGDVVKVDELEVWTELPTFNYVFADDLSSFDVRATYPLEEAKAFLNTHAFFAQLSASSSSHPSLDYFDAAITLLSDTFGPWDVPTQPSELAVQCACLWFVYQGDGLWERVGRVEEGKEAWGIWKGGLEERREGGGETGELVRKALGEVGRVEGV